MNNEEIIEKGIWAQVAEESESQKEITSNIFLLKESIDNNLKQMNIISSSLFQLWEKNLRNGSHLDFFSKENADKSFKHGVAIYSSKYKHYFDFVNNPYLSFYDFNQKEQENELQLIKANLETTKYLNELEAIKKRDVFSSFHIFLQIEEETRKINLIDWIQSNYAEIERMINFISITEKYTLEFQETSFQKKNSFEKSKNWFISKKNYCDNLTNIPKKSMILLNKEIELLKHQELTREWRDGLQVLINETNHNELTSKFIMYQEQLESAYQVNLFDEKNNLLILENEDKEENILLVNAKMIELVQSEHFNFEEMLNIAHPSENHPKF